MYTGSGQKSGLHDLIDRVEAGGPGLSPKMAIFKLRGGDVQRHPAIKLIVDLYRDATVNGSKGASRDATPQLVWK